MSFKIIYPKHRTKVTDSNISFKWDRYPTATAYQFELSQAPPPPQSDQRRGVPESQVVLSWKIIVNKTVKRNVSNLKLEPGNYYRCTITPSLPKGSPQGPSPAVCVFFLKKLENYLGKYLKSRYESRNPVGKQTRYLNRITPLFFFYLERHILTRKDPNFNPTPLDKSFSDVIDSKLKQFKDPKMCTFILDRLEKARNNYLNIDGNLKNIWFNKDLPKSISDTDWVIRSTKQLVQDLLPDNPPLKGISEAYKKKKTLELTFKNHPSTELEFIANDIEPNKGIKLRVEPEVVNAFSLKEEHAYQLKIIAAPNQSIEIPLKFQKDSLTGNYFINTEIDLSDVDSAMFDAEFYQLGVRNRPIKIMSNGKALIDGGVPVILKVTPNYFVPIPGPVQVYITVRDGGSHMGSIGVELEGSRQPLIKSIKRSEKTLRSQTFKFELDFSGFPPGTYKLSYRKDDETLSVNQQYIQLVDYKYSMSVRDIICINESYPEWFGDDSISFQVFANTAFFVSIPKSSSVYEGFSSNVSKRVNGDEGLFYVDDPAYSYRIIEDFITIHASLYEHDDLGWVGWLINVAIDIIQSFIVSFISAAIATVTGGSGAAIGLFIATGLEASGLNDMREELVNSMVSSWEIEVLHEGSFSLSKPNLESLPFDLPIVGYTYNHKFKYNHDNECQYALNLFFERTS